MNDCSTALRALHGDPGAPVQGPRDLWDCSALGPAVFFD